MASVSLVKCSCRHCDKELCIGTNIWTALDQVYSTPEDRDAFTHPGLDVIAQDRAGVKDSPLEGCKVHALQCTECRALMGVKCIDSSFGKKQYRGRIFVRLDDMTVTSVASGRETSPNIRAAHDVAQAGLEQHCSESSSRRQSKSRQQSQPKKKKQPKISPETKAQQIDESNLVETVREQSMDLHHIMYRIQTFQAEFDDLCHAFVGALEDRLQRQNGSSSSSSEEMQALMENVANVNGQLGDVHSLRLEVKFLSSKVKVLEQKLGIASGTPLTARARPDAIRSSSVRATSYPVQTYSSDIDPALQNGTVHSHTFGDRGAAHHAQEELGLESSNGEDEDEDQDPDINPVPKRRRLQVTPAVESLEGDEHEYPSPPVPRQFLNKRARDPVSPAAAAILSNMNGDIDEVEIENDEDDEDVSNNAEPQRPDPSIWAPAAGIRGHRIRWTRDGTIDGRTRHFLGTGHYRSDGPRDAEGYLLRADGKRDMRSVRIIDRIIVQKKRQSSQTDGDEAAVGGVATGDDNDATIPESEVSQTKRQSQEQEAEGEASRLSLQIDDGEGGEAPRAVSAVMYPPPAAQGNKRRRSAVSATASSSKKKTSARVASAPTPTGSIKQSNPTTTAVTTTAEAETTTIQDRINQGNADMAAAMRKSVVSS